MKDHAQVGRLALRHEGENWNAYYAENKSMEGAIFLGSIRMQAAIDNPELGEDFKMLMRKCVSDVIEDITGIKPKWDGETAAPEHERAGHA